MFHQVDSSCAEGLDWPLIWFTTRCTDGFDVIDSNDAIFGSHGTRVSVERLVLREQTAHEPIHISTNDNIFSK
jgi:hypothetical protein